MHRSSHSRHSAGSRSSSSHSNSSAFSANANPHEDWTKISDLAERRRIQNRIAQRNYRKKLKRRLEDLERRAGSSSASPERSQEPEEQIKPTPTTTRTRKHHRASKSISDTDGRNSTDLDFDSYHGQEDRGTMFSHQCTRQLSASPPPVFSYPSYPHLEYDGYGTPPPMYHNPVTGSYGEVTIPREYEYGDAMPTVPGAAAAAAVAAGVKRVHYYADDYEEIMSPFSMSYASMAGIDLCPTPQPLPESSLPISIPSQSSDQSLPSTSPDTSIVSGPLTPESDEFSPRSFGVV